MSVVFSGSAREALAAFQHQTLSLAIATAIQFARTAKIEGFKTAPKFRLFVPKALPQSKGIASTEDTTASKSERLDENVRRVAAREVRDKVSAKVKSQRVSTSTSTSNSTSTSKHKEKEKEKAAPSLRKKPKSKAKSEDTKKIKPAKVKPKPKEAVKVKTRGKAKKATPASTMTKKRKAAKPSKLRKKG
jgi:hypothetical protein